MPKKSKPSVLIVDDQPNWRKAFSDLLADEYDVTSVETYEVALRTLKQDTDLHVAVVDIRLNDKDRANEDGLRLIKELKGRYTRFIVATGYPTIRTVKEALRRLDAFDYIEKYPSDGKGFDRASFCRIVREAARDAERRRTREAYVVASFEEAMPGQPLQAERGYTLSLTLEDSPAEGDSLLIRPRTLQESTVEATIDVVNMRVQPSEVVRWTIPAGTKPSPLHVKLIPKRPGKQRIIIYLRVDGQPAGGIEKEVEVVAMGVDSRS